MKLKTLLIATFSLFLVFCSCKTHKPVATASHERIEERLKPIPINTDTIEITLSRDARLVRPPKTSKASKNDCALSIMHCALTKTTRPLTLQTTYTDTTQTLQITLKPDTIFVPYVHHIRSDTIIAPDPTTKTKMQKTQTANLLLILIIIAIIIIFFDRMTKRHNL